MLSIFKMRDPGSNWYTTTSSEPESGNPVANLGNICKLVGFLFGFALRTITFFGDLIIAQQ